jgi:hypothetical protein
LASRTTPRVRQTQRERQATAGSQLDKLRAIANDPHVYRVAELIEEMNQPIHLQGGRPRQYPDWCLVVFGACIRVFGSASATARALADPILWEIVRAGASQVLGLEATAAAPGRAPNRDHWVYFEKQRLDPEVLEAALSLQRELGVERATELGLLEPTDRLRVGSYRRENVVGIDGKVFSSPVRTLETDRVNRRTGELRPVRDDPARERYGEGGVDNIVWGTKFAIASVRSPRANQRVILGIEHFNSRVAGGEGQVFADLANDLASRADGIQAFTVDGAWRGKHLKDVQSTTGCGVVTPPRHQAAKRGGITVGRRSYAAQPLPWSPRRAKREEACGGHQIWASAGTLFEQVIDVEGTSTFVELHRHQTKRDVTVHKDGGEAHQFYAKYSMPCPRTGTTHNWWEPLLPIASDDANKFNRCEYLRIVPATSAEHERLYGMRQDTESLNAQLERAFYGQRMPAWGVHNQTVIVLMASLAENAWARSVS